MGLASNHRINDFHATTEHILCDRPRQRHSLPPGSVADLIDHFQQVPCHLQQPLWRMASRTQVNATNRRALRQNWQKADSHPLQVVQALVYRFSRIVSSAKAAIHPKFADPVQQQIHIKALIRKQIHGLCCRCSRSFCQTFAVDPLPCSPSS